MSELTVKRSINVEVTVDASFKKKYILLLNKLISQQNVRIDRLSNIDPTKTSHEAFKPYLERQLNELIFQKEQLKQQIEALKKYKDGDSFLLTTLEGQQSVEKGQSALDLVVPGTITVKDDVIDSILI